MDKNTGMVRQDGDLVTIGTAANGSFIMKRNCVLQIKSSSKIMIVSVISYKKHVFLSLLAKRTGSK